MSTGKNVGISEEDQESKKGCNDASAMEGGLQRKRREVSLSQRSFYSEEDWFEKPEWMPAVADLRTEIDELSIHPILQARMLDQTRAR